MLIELVLQVGAGFLNPDCLVIVAPAPNDIPRSHVASKGSGPRRLQPVRYHTRRGRVGVLERGQRADDTTLRPKRVGEAASGSRGAILQPGSCWRGQLTSEMVG